MCGLVGFVGDFPANRLKQMTNAIAHRGPDGEGEWHDQNRGIGLGHRRLSIIDTTDAAAQPMHTHCGRYITVLNGEIYNFKQLQQRPELQKHTYNPHSDTAILAPLYAEHGPHMLDFLNGIFAFAIYDKQEDTLFIARDHFGTKPLYYADTSAGLIFGSELKALLINPELDKQLDITATYDYLTYLWSPGERTALSHVKKLRPGHYMTIAHGQYKITEWYNPPLDMNLTQGTPNSYVKSPADLRGLFDEVVASQTIADVPVGAFLSGGVDSSAVVASMAHMGHKPKQTYCINFADTNMEAEGFSDDYTYAKRVATALDVPLKPVTMDHTCLDALPEMVAWLEEPTADIAPLFVNTISKHARADGIKVLLGGTGGDDIFSGYRRHQATMLRHKLGMFSQPFGVALSVAARSPMLPATLKRRFQKLGYILSGDENTFLMRSFEFHPRRMAIKCISSSFALNNMDNSSNSLEFALVVSEGASPLNRQLYMELFGFLPDHNLNYTDKASMVTGVEVRVPFLDPRLIQYAYNLPLQEKVRGHEAKWHLKKAMEPRLPHDILYRAKAGFGAPLRKWLIEDRRDWVHDILFSTKARTRGIYNTKYIEELIENNSRNKLDATYLIFALVSLELWHQHFLDGKTHITKKAA